MKTDILLQFWRKILVFLELKSHLNSNTLLNSKTYNSYSSSYYYMCCAFDCYAERSDIKLSKPIITIPRVDQKVYSFLKIAYHLSVLNIKFIIICVLKVNSCAQNM